ncbi:MAG: Ig-like domain-containing protein, partial [Actinomycetota bacterium]
MQHRQRGRPDLAQPGCQLVRHRRHELLRAVADADRIVELRHLLHWRGVHRKPGHRDDDPSSTANPSVAGKPVEFMATVTGPIPPTGTAIIPTGSVQFGVDGTNSGSPVTLVGGMATSTTISNLAVGNHTVTATYPANNSNLMANSDTLEGGQLVNPASTTTTVTSSANASVFGPPVSFTAMTPSSTANPSVAGKPVEFMATVTGPIPPTGTAII